MNFFVNKSDTINIPVYVWLDDRNDISATHDKNEIPEKIKYETILMTIRKPSYGDSKIIMSVSRSSEGVDPLQLHDQILRTLMVNWDLKENGLPVEYSVSKIDSLSPVIARAASSGILSVVTI